MYVFFQGREIPIVHRVIKVNILCIIKYFLFCQVLSMIKFYSRRFMNDKILEKLMSWLKVLVYLIDVLYTLVL